jgi:hypothetical protein
MKLSRKMQSQIESKIRHSMVTSQLLIMKRSTTGTLPRPESDKVDNAGQSK